MLTRLQHALRHNGIFVVYPNGQTLLMFADEAGWNNYHGGMCSEQAHDAIALGLTVVDYRPCPDIEALSAVILSGPSIALCLEDEGQPDFIERAEWLAARQAVGATVYNA